MRALLIITGSLLVGFTEAKEKEVDPICEKITFDRDKALSDMDKIKIPEKKLFSQLSLAKFSADYSKACSDLSKAIKEKYSNYPNIYADHSKAHAALSRAASDYSKAADDINKYCKKDNFLKQKKENSENKNNRKTK